MSKAKPTQIKINKSGQIFAKIKNGNIYRLNANVNPAQSEAVAQRIKDAGAIHLKHWTKCEPRPANHGSMIQTHAWLSEDRPRVSAMQNYFQVFEKRAREAAAAGNMHKLKGMWHRKVRKAEALSKQIGPNGENSEVFMMVQMERDLVASLIKEVA